MRGLSPLLPTIHFNDARLVSPSIVLSPRLSTVPMINDCRKIYLLLFPRLYLQKLSDKREFRHLCKTVRTGTCGDEIGSDNGELLIEQYSFAASPSVLKTDRKTIRTVVDKINANRFRLTWFRVRWRSI